MFTWNDWVAGRFLLAYNHMVSESGFKVRSEAGLIKQHYNDVIMGAIASQITSLTIVYSVVYSEADQSKHQSSASLAFVRGNHRGPVNSPHKWPVTRKMFPFDDVIMDNVSIVPFQCTCMSMSVWGWHCYKEMDRWRIFLFVQFIV